jgi:hypothetical protein
MRRFSFPVSQRMMKRLALSIGVLGSIWVSSASAEIGGVHSDHFFRLITCPRLAQPVQVDGRLDEWDLSRAPIVLTQESVKQWGYQSPPVNGDADCSARALLAWDDRGLYFAADVTDDAVFGLPEAPTVPVKNMWEYEIWSEALAEPVPAGKRTTASLRIPVGTLRPAARVTLGVEIATADGKTVSATAPIRVVSSQVVKSVPPSANAWPGIAASGDPSRYALPSARDTVGRKQWPAVTKEDYYKLACALSTEEYRVPRQKSSKLRVAEFVRIRGYFARAGDGRIPRILTNSATLRRNAQLQRQKSPAQVAAEPHCWGYTLAIYALGRYVHDKDPAMLALTKAQMHASYLFEKQAAGKKDGGGVLLYADFWRWWFYICTLGQSTVGRVEKGSEAFYRNGPEGAAHKMLLTPPLSISGQWPASQGRGDIRSPTRSHRPHRPRCDFVGERNEPVDDRERRLVSLRCRGRCAVRLRQQPGAHPCNCPRSIAARTCCKEVLPRTARSASHG